jgi:hypothetical protein
MHDYDFACIITENLSKDYMISFETISYSLEKSCGNDLDKYEKILSVIENKYPKLLAEKVKYNRFIQFSEASVKSQNFDLYRWLCKRNDIYRLKSKIYAKILFRNVNNFEDYSKLLSDEYLTKDEFEAYINGMIYVLSINDICLTDLIKFMINKKSLWDIIDDIIYKNEWITIKVKRLLQGVNYINVISSCIRYSICDDTTDDDFNSMTNIQNMDDFCKRYGCKNIIDESTSIYEILCRMSVNNRFGLWLLFCDVRNVDKFVSYDNGKCEKCDPYNFVGNTRNVSRVKKMKPIEHKNLTKVLNEKTRNIQILSDIFVSHFVKLNVDLEEIEQILFKLCVENNDCDDAMFCALELSFKNYDISPELEYSRNGIIMLQNVIRQYKEH